MIGIIGVGNMGGAILKGILGSGVFDVKEVLASDHSESKKEEYPGVRFLSAKEVFEQSDHVILAVKPQALDDLLIELNEVQEEKHIISVLVGVSSFVLEKKFKTERVSLVMPNTPCLIKDGMTGLTFSKGVLEEDKTLVKNIFSTLGGTAEIKEEEMDIFGTIAGAMPAYVFVMIDAIMDIAIKHGLKKEQARAFASRAVMGSAHLSLESELSISDLKSMVTSPSGTTIEGVLKLEEAGFRQAIQKAIDASTEKSKKMRG